MSPFLPGMDAGPRWCIGLMTGTALDGMVDVAALRTDGERILAFGPSALLPYPFPLRGLLEETQRAALAWGFSGPEPAVFARAEDALTRAQADAVRDFLQREGIAAAEVALIGFHGQTVLHRAPRRATDKEPAQPGATRQLGDGMLMSRILGIDVAYDFRSADIAAGGQGAPLAAIYHVALLEGLGAASHGSAVLNLGGVGNITWRDGAGTVIAFDTGPANGPINDWVSRLGMGEMDRDGRLAASGQVDEARLQQLLLHPFLFAVPPKSLDRFDFTADLAAGLGPADGAATLTALAAGCIARGLDLLPTRPDRLIVCGGGRRNPTLMGELARRTGIRIDPAEIVGWRGDAVEAECFAFLAARVAAGLPISFPGTTGVGAPMTGGRIARCDGRA